MKKILLIVAAIAMFAACSSPEKKAEKLIKSNLQETLNDPKSYESISFGKLDTINSKMTEQEELEYDKLITEFTKVNEEFSAFVEEHKYSDIEDMDAFKKKGDELHGKSKAAQKKCDDFEKNCKGEQRWKMSHKYRAKNAMGAVVLVEREFYLDKELTKVLGSEKVE